MASLNVGELVAMAELRSNEEAVDVACNASRLDALSKALHKGRVPLSALSNNTRETLSRVVVLALLSFLSKKEKKTKAKKESRALSKRLSGSLCEG